MRNTIISKNIAAPALDPFARRTRPTRMHPRRDPEGHNNPGGNGNETPEEKALREQQEARANETAEARAAREAQEALSEGRNLADWLIAEANFRLEQQQAAGRTAEQQQAHEAQQAAINAAVEAARVEQAAAFTAQIEGLNNQIIDGIINGELGKTGRSADSYKVVLATLDKKRFVGDDGAVKKDEVVKWATELAGTNSSRPPRTGGGREGGTRDRGFGHLLEQK